jgi:flagellar biosynthesis GTPase FlhF
MSSQPKCVCGRGLVSGAIHCPHCGAKVGRRPIFDKTLGIALAVLLVIAAFVGGAFMPRQHRDYSVELGEAKAQSEQLTSQLESERRSRLTAEKAVTVATSTSGQVQAQVQSLQAELEKAKSERAIFEEIARTSKEAFEAQGPQIKKLGEEIARMQKRPPSTPLAIAEKKHTIRPERQSRELAVTANEVQPRWLDCPRSDSPDHRTARRC